MLVGVLNRDPNAFPGGDLIHIKELSRALDEIGVEREYIGGGWTPDSLKAKYDLVHVYHVNFGWSRQNFNGVSRSGVPWIVTTVFYPQCFDTDWAKVRAMVDGAGAVAAYSHREWRELSRLTGYERYVNVIPPGVAERFHDTTPFDDRPKDVLTVAARGGDKNADVVKKLCDSLEVQCDSISGVDHDELHEVYPQYKVFVNASVSERFGLTILEGLAAGCRVLATDQSWGLEWLPGIHTIDPFDEFDIGKEIFKALHAEDWDYSVNDIARRMTWDLSALQYSFLYKRVLEAHNAQA